jgi:lysophospholipase L1-like esterase
MNGGRLESFFSRVGLVATALLALFVLLLLDLALTTCFSPDSSSESDDFSLHFVTLDGREIGGRAGGVTVALRPLTVYENAPNQHGPGSHINAFGLRGSEIALEPTRPRVVVVGGSAAFGLRVPERATFAAGLESRLAGVEVLNAGVSGYLSAQELALVVTRLLDLRPDVLVVFDGWNDVYAPYWWSRFGDGKRAHPGVNTGFLTIEDRLVRYREIQRNPLAALLEAGQTLLSRSSVLGALANLLRPESGADSGGGLDDAQRSAIASGYVANLRKLHDLTSARGIGLLVVVQPELVQYMTPEKRSQLEGRSTGNFFSGDAYVVHFPETYSEFRRRVIPALRASGVRVIDASERFARLTAPQALFIDPVHLSVNGHDQMARILEEPVARLLESTRLHDVPASQP